LYFAVRIQIIWKKYLNYFEKRNLYFVTEILFKSNWSNFGFTVFSLIGLLSPRCMVSCIVAMLVGDNFIVSYSHVGQGKHVHAALSELN